MVYNWTNKLQSLLFPPTCRLCLAPGQERLEICPDCHRELPWLTHSCSGCALPLPAESDASLCSNCQKRRLKLDSCRALFGYQPPVDQWIQRLKFRQDLSLARLLGELLAREVASPTPHSQPVLVPVPLHRKRLAERGYNQALEISRPLHRLGYRIDTDICHRIAATRAQTSLSAQARRANVRSAFSVKKRLQDKAIILVDDVMTTGATLDELAARLKQAGAERVDAWVIARTVI